MVMLLALSVQFALLQLPPPAPPGPPGAEAYTRPLVDVACELGAPAGISGRVELSISGGRAFPSEMAPTVGQSAAAGFRRTAQEVSIRRDELNLIPAATIDRVDMGGEGGIIGFRARMFGNEDERFWRLAFWRARPAWTSPGPDQPFEAAVIDPEGKKGYAGGTCTLRATAQRPLTADELALETD